MSRRSTSQQHPRVLVHPTLDNPYQTTTENFTRSHYRTSSHRPRDHPYHAPSCNHHYNKHSCNSDTDTNTYYEYYSDDIFQPSPTKKELRNNVDYVFSDDSSSTRLPHYEELTLKKHSRSASYDRKTQQVTVKNGKVLNSVLVHKDVRRVYPNQEESERLYHEVLDPRSSTSESNQPRRDLLRSRLSDRAQSLQSSEIGSAIVDGCGGRCQTFENVCYYFLQVALTMGILIGTSLCIAGAVLRKSAARNLQVLVYIGAMLFLVSALLLGVQCRARHAARKRRKALRNAKRAPIPLDTLHRPPIHEVFVDQPPPPPTRVALNQQYPQRQVVVTQNPLAEEQGIPWWRRKDPT